jgi:hypothetical protein
MRSVTPFVRLGRFPISHWRCPPPFSPFVRASTSALRSHMLSQPVIERKRVLLGRARQLARVSLTPTDSFGFVHMRTMVPPDVL